MIVFCVVARMKTGNMAEKLHYYTYSLKNGPKFWPILNLQTFSFSNRWNVISCPMASWFSYDRFSVGREWSVEITLKDNQTFGVIDQIDAYIIQSRWSLICKFDIHKARNREGN